MIGAFAVGLVLALAITVGSSMVITNTAAPEPVNEPLYNYGDR
ncbi:hypothetical protein CLV72_101162 [Allonocardiopsis opalescens]|uniref:DUF2613 family protein n=1 Tax=Allonocardiopsis opalescens TaxID=1144618 RepID=A0A2T0QCD5_9ACTN|nr:hypothetical protein CLV72_101162 [Allonocardiopsis opalescens]